MEPDVTNRFDRIISILIQLQSKKIVKAVDLAERFQVSLRTIYRDIKSLNAAGVPVVGEAGTGYSMMEGYRLPPVMFTREEAGSFAAAEKLMQHFTDESLGQYFQSALYKIKSVLRSAEKEWVEILDSHISMHTAQHSFNQDIPNALEILFESMAQKKQVVLDYKSLNQTESTRRQIEVVGLFHENRFWYILGYCHLRKDYRQFRIDRIQGIMRSEEDYTRIHGSVEDHRHRGVGTEKQDVHILVDSEVVKYLKYDRDAYGFVSEKPAGDHQVEMFFRTPLHGEGFVRWFLMFADHAQVLEPESIKIRVGEILNRGLDRLKD